MSLSETQHAILKGMMVGALFAVAIVILGASLNPFNYQDSLSIIDRISVAITSGLIPIVFLTISIGRMAKHRFFSTVDIDWVASNDTDRTKELQTLLQNTLEQTLLAIAVYCAWSVIMPAKWLSVVPIAAIFFGLGRIIFFTGFKNGASSRAVGFTFTFYPSVAMLISILGSIFWQQIS